MKKIVSSLVLAIVSAAMADTLVYRGKNYSGILAEYSKTRLFFQEWDGARPEAYDPVKVEKIVFDTPMKITLYLSKEPKKAREASLKSFARGHFVFVLDGEETDLHYRYITRLESNMSPREIMERRQDALDAEKGKTKGETVSSMVEPGKINVFHFHVDDGPASQRQGNLAERLCKESKKKAVYQKITFTDLNDPKAKKYKLASLPQFWFISAKGVVIVRLADRFTEEDIEEAFQRASKGK